MNPITQTIKEMNKKFGKEFVSERLPNGYAMVNGYECAQEILGEVESFITQSHIALLESVVGVVERVEKKPSAKSLLVQDCPNCGQEVNREFVDNLTVEIKTEALQDILTELQEALKELKDNK